MAEASLLPNQDVTSTVHHDLRPGERRRFGVVAFAFETPGPSTPQLYTDQSQVDINHGAESIFGRWAQQFFGQEITPDVVRGIPIVRTAGRPATDWSNQLSQYQEEYGTNFYRIAIETDVPAEQLEVINWAAATGQLDAVRFFGRSHPGDRATVVDGVDPDQYTVTVRYAGEVGNLFQYRVDIEEDENGDPIANHALDALVETLDDEAKRLLIHPATDDTGVITSTIGDVVEQINVDADSSILFFAELGDSADETTLVTETGGDVAFDGGGENADLVLDDDGLPDVSQIVERAELAETDRADLYFHVESQPYFSEAGGVNAVINGYWPDAVGVAIGAVRNPGSFTYKDRPTQGTPDVGNRDLFGDYALTRTAISELRQGKINTMRENPIGIIRVTDGFATSGLFADIREAGDVLLTWDIQELHDLLSQPPGGRGKVPYADPGFSMIQDRLWRNTRRATLPQWNFIQTDPNTGQPAARIQAPRYVDLLNTDPGLIKLRHYPVIREATYQGAVHEIDVTTYLTVEFIATELTAFEVA